MIKLDLLNIRSLSTKLLVNGTITDHNPDVLCMTETWLKPEDYINLNESTPQDYCYKQSIFLGSASSLELGASSRPSWGWWRWLQERVMSCNSGGINGWLNWRCPAMPVCCMLAVHCICALQRKQETKKKTAFERGARKQVCLKKKNVLIINVLIFLFY